jgi:hypothetical protein
LQKVLKARNDEPAKQDDASDRRKMEASKHLSARLSPKTEKLLTNHRPDIPPTQSLNSALIGDINQVLERKDLYSLPPFDDLEVTDKMNRLVHFFTAADWPSEPPPIQEKTIKALIKPPGNEIKGLYKIGLKYLLDQVYPTEIIPCEYPLPPFKLMHVVNTALNLVHGKNLAWQQRKAESFSISPLHCGSPNLRCELRTGGERKEVEQHYGA